MVHSFIQHMQTGLRWFLLTLEITFNFKLKYLEIILLTFVILLKYHFISKQHKPDTKLPEWDVPPL